MTKDDIIRMAREAGFEFNSLGGTYTNGSLSENLERFAKLVAAAEREACAKVCETLWNTPDNGMATEEEAYGEKCAEAIRARGQQ